MDEISQGLLAKILSAGNVARRDVKDFVSNPGDYLDKILGVMTDSTESDRTPMAKLTPEKVNEIASNFLAPGVGGIIAGPKAASSFVKEAINTGKSFMFPGSVLPRVHISDVAAALKIDPQITQKTTLGDILFHPELFKAYPELSSVPVRIRSAEGSARYNTQSGISIPSDKPENFISRLLHEIQHGVQEVEGFAKGGSVDDILARKTDELIYQKDADLRDAVENYRSAWRNTSREIRPKSAVGLNLRGSEIEDWFDSLQYVTDPKAKKEFERLLGEIDFARQEAFGLNEGTLARMSAEKEYKNLAGEVEARLVQSLLKAEKEGTQFSTPLELIDVPLGDIITRFD